MDIWKNKRLVGDMKKTILIVIFGILLVSSFNFVSPAGTLSIGSECCEQTTEGALCVNTDASNCDFSSRSSPTSCSSTSYCKPGTCYDSSEGICMENTPQNVCQEQGGTWDEREINEIPQCNLGCCIIADQAAFVPLVRCKKLSSLFGVGMTYKAEITSEVQCIAEANSQEMGACVYEKDYGRTCEFTTRGDCQAAEVVEEINETELTYTSEKKFYKDFLCSAEELGTECARQMTTSCYKGKVYWIDSCGNRENVYSADKETSWNRGRVAQPDDICEANDGSNKDCGNCDYFLGSRCGEAEGILSKPKYGNYICERTDCGDKKNGESWCVYDGDVGEGSDPVGSRHYRHVCVDGEILVEPCADFRNEVCLEGDVISGFSAAACRVNRWHECILQTKEEDCMNGDVRDCMWIEEVPVGLFISNETSMGSTFSGQQTQGETFEGNEEVVDTTSNGSITGQAIFGGGDDDDDEEEEGPEPNRQKGICVPNYPPGFNFWEQGDAGGICGQASLQCIVIFEKTKKIIGGDDDYECEENCECIEDEWASQANNICKSLGDCGGYENFVGVSTNDGYQWMIDGEEVQIGEEHEAKSGLVIGLDMIKKMFEK